MQKTTQNLEIDKLDKDILSILILDASVPYTDIAKKLLVSGGTIHVRMKKLEEMGVVQGNYLNINPAKVGYDVCAFLGIYLNKASEYRDAVRELERISEIVEMHYTTGTYSMFAKVLCRDTKHLREVLNERIQVIKGVQRTETFISLEESIKRQIKIE
jgi:Lrp/AsnC family transcriptional regulator for asnA, asnC and gidA